MKRTSVRWQTKTLIVQRLLILKDPSLDFGATLVYLGILWDNCFCLSMIWSRFGFDIALIRIENLARISATADRIAKRAVPRIHADGPVLPSSADGSVEIHLSHHLFIKSHI